MIFHKVLLRFNKSGGKEVIIARINKNKNEDNVFPLGGVAFHRAFFLLLFLIR